jgi:hypothetical protein
MNASISATAPTEVCGVVATIFLKAEFQASDTTAFACPHTPQEDKAMTTTSSAMLVRLEINFSGLELSSSSPVIFFEAIQMVINHKLSLSKTNR